MTPCYLPLLDEVRPLDYDFPTGQWGESEPIPFTDTETFAWTYFYAIPLRQESYSGPSSSLVPDSLFQFAWDSTSLGELKTCPRKYLFGILQGHTHKMMPPPLAFGIHYHTCMETWHKLVIGEKMDPELALCRIVRLAGLLGETIPVGDTSRTKETLVRSVVWYIDTFSTDPARTVTLSNGKPAVEYSFTLPFVEVQGIQTYLSGHIDRVVEFQGGIYPTDYKSTKYQLDSRFFAQFKPNHQCAQYVMATNVLATEGTAIDSAADGIIIDGLQLGVNYTRYRRQIIPFKESEIDDFISDTQTWIELAHYFAESGRWPANEKACNMYSGCHFREVCKQPPKFREQALKTHFVKRTWDPMRSR